MTIKVQVYARLKDYFESEMTLDLEDGLTIKELVNYLNKFNPLAKDILAHSRIAVDESYADPSQQLKAQDKILIFPPSSGG